MTPLCGDDLYGPEQGGGGLRIVTALEEAPQGSPFAVRLVVHCIVDRGDPADRHAAATGNEQPDLGVTEEGVSNPIQHLPLLCPQRRDPVRVRALHQVGHLEEVGKGGTLVGNDDDDRGSRSIHQSKPTPGKGCRHGCLMATAGSRPPLASKPPE